MSILLSLLRSPIASALTAPHGVDRYLELVDPAWSVREVRGTIERAVRDTPSSVRLVIRPNGNWRGHRAGQFVRVSVEINGVRHTRCYSIASSAHRRDRITLGIKARDGGFVSRHLVEHALPGQVLVLSHAAGEFVLPDERPNRVILISGGSGITPVMSMLRTLLDEDYRGEIVFLHYARSREDAMFAGELAAVRAPNVRMECIFGDIFRPEHLEDLDIDTAETFVCGPEPMMAAVRAAGVRRLHEERFTEPTIVRSDDGGSIRFLRSNKRAACSGKTLLESAEDEGLNPEFGCRRGICHGCTRRKVAGAVRDLRTGAVSDAPDQDIQLCVSAAVGEVALDL
jgi:ferredoxin-NADP reductase